MRTILDSVQYQSLNAFCIGCRIEYLPPYSPDYNPIEQAFSAIKSYLKRLGLGFSHTGALYYELYRSCEIVTAEMSMGFFRHAGYMV